MDRVLFATVFSCLVFYSFACISDTDTENLSNERFPVDKYFLEKQWGVNCDNAVKTTQKWLSVNPSQHQKKWDVLKWQDLYRCGLLFNTPGTGRFERCPDFNKAHKLLLRMRKKENSIDLTKIMVALSTNCKSN